MNNSGNTVDSNSLHSRLVQGLQQMSLELPGNSITLLIDYVLLLNRWNAVYNLTAVRDPVEMISRHVLDSLSLLTIENVGQQVATTGDTLLDVGTGAGLPGIPLAITRPELACTLLDSNGKKTRFVQQAVSQLQLSNVTVLNQRIEALSDRQFGIVISRAFSSPSEFLQLAGKHCRVDGTITLMLGPLGDKLDDLPSDYTLESVKPVTIPFEDSTRHIVVCRPQPTPQ